VGFVVDKVALGQIFSEYVLRFTLPIPIPPIAPQSSSLSSSSLRNAFCCVLVLYIELYFPVKHNNISINSHITVHNWVYFSYNVATYFVSWSHSQAIYQQPYTIELCILYGSIYYSQFPLITIICTNCILYCFKNVLNMYLKLLKVLKHYLND
jgi:hypothetical protein